MRRNPTGTVGKVLRPRRVLYRPRVEAFERRVLLATFTVTNNTDGGPGSLRQAITDSNSTSPGPNTIDFNIAVGAVGLTKIPTVSSGPIDITTGPDGNLWFTEGSADKIGRITPAGVITEFPVSTPGANPDGITAGPDGNLWFTEFAGNKIGRITPTGTITEFPVPTGGSSPVSIVTGPDGNLWFTEFAGNKIGRITPTGTITEFPVLTSGSGPDGITAGPDGNLWFTEIGASQVGRITPTGVVTEFSAPPSGGSPEVITAGPDGNLWFTDQTTNQIARITTAGVVTTFTVPTANAQPLYITAAPDGNLWFTESANGQTGRITPAGVITEFPAPTSGTAPFGITAGPDGNLWIAENGANAIGRLTLAPASAGTTITPASALPTITTAVTIDGYSQPGARANTLAVGDNAVLKIVLDGAKAGATDGLRLAAPGITVQGLVIDHFTGIGVHIIASNDQVFGDFIGIDATGATAQANQGIGVSIDGFINNALSGTMIGGPSPAQRNLISGNVQQGIFAGFLTTSTGNAIVNNYIGTNAAGTAAVPNGTMPAQPLSGILVQSAVHTVIGVPGAGNLVAGNLGGGIAVAGSTSSANLVQGNLIGTDASGNQPTFTNPGSGFFTNGSNNTIGGTAPGDGNTIAYTSGNGVVIQTGTGNAVLGNAIFANVAAGIALVAAGTSTQFGNNNQPAPILSSAVTSGGSTTFTGTITGSGTAPYTIQFFANPTTNSAQGQQFLGQTTVAANGSFSVTLPTPSLVGPFFTATATDAGNNTSMFSFTFPNVVTNTNDSGPGSLRQAILNIDASGASAPPGVVPTITFAIPGTGVHTISPASPLPAITSPVLIDGYSQPRASANTLAQGDNAVLNIVLDGSHTGPGVDGLVLTAGNSTVRGLVINNFSGNGAYGGEIHLMGNGHNLIEGNFLGADATGTSAPNTTITGEVGVSINSSANNAIGGTTLDARNLISGNTGAGILIASAPATNNVVEENLLGTDSSGSAPLNNGLGVLILAGASQNTIGGAAAAQGNTIAFNSTDGVNVNGSNGNTIGFNTIAFNAGNGVTVNAGTGNPILSNSIDSNSGVGIALANNGNNNQAAPILTSAITTGGNTTFTGTIAGSGTAPYTIQFFANPSATGAQGQQFLGQTIVAANGTFSATIPTPSLMGIVFTATATDANNNTSMFSAPFVQPIRSTVVTNTNDSGPGSLRQAILDANAGTGLQTITFAIPPSGMDSGSGGVATIRLVSPLPPISHQVVINGYSQPGSSSNTLAVGDNAVIEIVLDGSHAGASADGLDLSAGGSTVEGLVIDNFSRNGIVLGSSGNTLSGNFIGIDATGTTAQGNQGPGVNINSPNNLVGGTLPADRNVISGNTREGIFSGSGGNDTFENNYIGTNAAGTAKVGNLIGLNLINGVSRNTIGTAGAGNLISGNTQDGIDLNGNGAVEQNNTVQGNLIGTDATGTLPVPNGGDGVVVTAGAVNNIVGGGNTIAFNGGDGVFVSGGAGNAILSNSIFSNGSVVPAGLGIRLGPNGNNQQTFPVLVTSSPSPAGVRSVIGALQAVANTTYLIQVFASPAPSPTGFGEGKTQIDQFHVTTDATGLAAINFGLPASVGANQVITATATDLSRNNTSEFSQVSDDLAVTGVAVPVGFGQEGDLLSFVFTVDSNGPSPAVGARLAATIPAGSSFVSASIGTTPVSVSPVNGVVTIPLGALDRGNTTTVSVVVLINTTAPLSTTATVSSATADLVPNNNSVTVNYGTPNVFTVTTTADNGNNAQPISHSLRQAITRVNADSFNTSADHIVFEIGAGTQTIQPVNALPALTHPVIIDGTAPSQYSTQVIELDGSHAGLYANGLVISGGNSTVRDLTINRFGASGLLLDTKGGDIVESNFIGTDVTGTQPRGNSLDGIDIDGTSGNMIGLPGAGNVIGANQVGVYLYDGASSNAIMANMIGGVAPNSPLGNLSGGVLIAGSNGNLVGGMSPDQGNVIGGSPAYSGVVLFSGATQNTVAFNTILANGNAGVYILDSPANRIGAAGAPNNIMGNSFAGVDIEGKSSTSNVVQYNQIAQNAHDGVYLFQAPSNVIGGPGGAGNIIVGSGFSGMHIDGPAATGNVVQGNTITGSMGYGVLIEDATGNVIGGSGDASNTLLNNAFGTIQVLDVGLPASTTAGGNIILGNTTQASTVAVGTMALSHPKSAELHPSVHVPTHLKTVAMLHKKALPSGPVGSFSKAARVASRSILKTK